MIPQLNFFIGTSVGRDDLRRSRLLASLVLLLLGLASASPAVAQRKVERADVEVTRTPPRWRAA